ncbi:MAG: hypothetical protein U1F43_32615 [Myxococcota bacterium]
MVRAADEPTLAAFVPGADDGALFRWLESRAFMDWAPSGLRPHELARDVLAADLLLRAPDRHAAITRAAIDCAVERLQRGTVDPDRVVLDVLFIHRGGLALGADWDSAAELRADLARPDDAPAILDMVRRHEGEASAALRPPARAYRGARPLARRRGVGLRRLPGARARVPERPPGRSRRLRAAW